MLTFYLASYKISISPVYAVEVLNHMWATEPVGTFSILLTGMGLLLTLAFKLFDLGWDAHKERARQGRLKIELMGECLPDQSRALCAILSNTGREPMVVREVGYARPRLLGREFVAVAPLGDVLPHALNAKDLLRVRVPEAAMNLDQLAQAFQVRDSMGKLWNASDVEIRKARRQLQALQAKPRGRERKPLPTGAVSADLPFANTPRRGD